MDDPRMAWSGMCNECHTIAVIFADDNRDLAEHTEFNSTWPTKFASCYVLDCEGTVEWNGNDPVAQVVAARML